MRHEKRLTLRALTLATVVLFSLLLVSPRAPAGPRRQQVKPPIEKEGLLRALKERALSDRELMREIAARGVSFQLTTPAAENEIRRAAGYLGKRGRDNLIAALRANYRAPAGVNPATPKRPDIYRARVTVIDPQRKPVDDAKVWSSIGGEPKKVAGGWQFDIPAASVPADGKVTFFATKESAFLAGEHDLQLTTDTSPAVTIELIKNIKGVVVRGTVIDEAGNAIGEVRVSVAGYEAESVITQPNGGFVLPAHAAVGQQVLVHAEKPGYKAINQYHPAGEEPATIILERR